MVYLKYYINNQPIKVNKLLYNRLGKGKEGSVYRFEDKAIKIYKIKNGKIKLFPQYVNYEKTMNMSNLKLHRFNKPLDAVFNKHNQFCGHTMDLILGNGYIIDMSIETFLEELALLETDIKQLTRSFFRIRDVHQDNIKINERINILDCNSYELLDQTIRQNDPSTLKDDLNSNYHQINKVIIERLAHESKKQLLSNDEANVWEICYLLRETFAMPGCHYLGHSCEKININQFTTPKEYIKTIINKTLYI